MADPTKPNEDEKPETYTWLKVDKNPVSRFSERDPGQWYYTSEDETARHVLGTDKKNDAIQGNEKTDFIYAGTGDDLVWGMEFPDILAGQVGDDILIGNSGRDTLSGAVGNDILVGDDWVYRTHGDIEGWNGELFRTKLDTVLNNAEGDFLYGGDGSDLLYGGKGGDLLRGGSGKDVLHGEEGDDVLDGDNDPDVKSGNDPEAERGNDLLYGGGGNDTLKGREGNDILAGGEGEDELYGGKGNDRFVVKTSDSGDTIHDFRNGTDSNIIEIVIDSQNALVRFTDNNGKLKGFDALEFENRTENDETFLRVKYSDDNFVELKNVSKDELSAADFEFTVSDKLFQGGTIPGLADYDVIATGTDMGERVTGHTGNDVIDGRKGNDDLDGVGGADKFIFRRGDGQDRIELYELDPDNLDKSDSISFEFAAGVLGLLRNSENQGYFKNPEDIPEDRRHDQVVVTRDSEAGGLEGDAEYIVYYGVSDSIRFYGDENLALDELNILF